jgi:hypothetical protein
MNVSKGELAMGFSIQNPKNAVDAKRAAIEARKASTAPAGTNPSAIVRYIPPGECPDRNRIVFDDSGSMGGYIEDAKLGMIEYLRNCIPNQTSVAIHFMNSTACDTQLESNLLKLATDIREINLRSGGTPFFNTLKKALEATPTLTRLIAFTDGSPTDALAADYGEELDTYYGSNSNPWIHSADVIIKIAKATGSGIPIDTVYFGVGAEYERKEIELLKYLSSKTGGYFLHFDPAKVNFAQAFKYLAPCHRLMLASASFRAQVESGAQK